MTRHTTIPLFRPALAAAVGAALIASVAVAAPARAVVGGRDAGNAAWTRSVVDVQAAEIDRSGDEPEQGPWRHHCGGTVIGRSTIVTADHCFEGTDAHFRVVFGARTSASEPGRTAQVRDIKEIRRSATDHKTNDLALVRLARPLHGAVAARLPEDGDHRATVPGQRVLLAGWGQTVPGPLDEDDASEPRRLQTATVPVVRNDACSGTSTTFCAGAPDVGTCFGDSGGPVFAAPVARRPVLVGIVSSAAGECGAQDTVGVYAATADHANREAVGLG